MFITTFLKIIYNPELPTITIRDGVHCTDADSRASTFIFLFNHILHVNSFCKSYKILCNSLHGPENVIRRYRFQRLGNEMRTSIYLLLMIFSWSALAVQFTYSFVSVI